MTAPEEVHERAREAGVARMREVGLIGGTTEAIRAAVEVAYVDGQRRALTEQITRWFDQYEAPQDAPGEPGRRVVLSFGDDGLRALVFVVDVESPPRTVEEWRAVAHLDIDTEGGGYGTWLAAVAD